MPKNSKKSKISDYEINSDEEDDEESESDESDKDEQQGEDIELLEEIEAEDQTVELTTDDLIVSTLRKFSR